MQRDPVLQTATQQVLFIPGLISWFLSGQAVNEFTIASTSGLLKAAHDDWHHALMARLGLSSAWFSPVRVGGADLGPIRSNIADELNLNQDLHLIAGASHDTAAALLALPLPPTERQNRAFISAGTWSIIGCFTDKPIITPAAFADGLTNEGTFDGGNRLLKNVTGLWLLQQLKQEWMHAGEALTYPQMIALAASIDDNHSYLDVNDPLFTKPGPMAKRIHQYLAQTQQEVPRSRGHLLRIVYESLALAYHQTITQLQRVTGQSINVIHMFGGGIQDALLLQLTADYTQRPIITGPIEASAIGNLISQLLVTKQLDETSALAVLKRSYQTQTITPKHVPPARAYSTFAALSQRIAPSTTQQ